MAWKIKKLDGSRVHIGGIEYTISPELQKTFTNTSGVRVQELSNNSKVNLNKTLHAFRNFDFAPKSGTKTGGTNDFDHNIRLINIFKIQKFKKLEEKESKVSSPQT